MIHLLTFGCCFLLWNSFHIFKWYKWSEVAQSCPTLCDPMDCSLPHSSIHGIFQARVLEWVAISFSRGSFRPRDQTQVSCIVGRRFTVWATREVLKQNGLCTWSFGNLTETILHLSQFILCFSSVQFSHSVLSESATPWTATCQASLSITNSRSLLKLLFIESVMPSNHFTLCHPFLLLPSIFPSIKVFSNESVLRIRWPKYWSFSFSISPSNEYSGLISFRMDQLDLLAVQGTLKSLFQHHSSEASILRHSACSIVQLSHRYMTTGKIIALIRQTFTGKVMSLLFNMLSRFVIAFFSRSKHLLISYLQSPSAVILEPKKIKYVTVSIVSPSICHEVMGLDDVSFLNDLSFLNVEFYASFFTLLFHFHQEAL